MRAGASGDPTSPRTAIYTIFGTLVAFKLATALWIISLQPSAHGVAFLTFTSMLWFALVAIPLGIGGLFWYRRLRARAKRRRLIHAEWHVDTPATPRQRIR